MLPPVKSPTSNLYTSSDKLMPAEEELPFLTPDFFTPLEKDQGLSCTYSQEFYRTFSDNPEKSKNNQLAMLTLEYMALNDKARLPLFRGASAQYAKQVVCRGQEISDTSISFFAAIFCSKTAGGRLPNTECTRSQL